MPLPPGIRARRKPSFRLDNRKRCDKISFCGASRSGSELGDEIVAIFALRWISNKKKKNNISLFISKFNVKTQQCPIKLKHHFIVYSRNEVSTLTLVH